MTASVRDGDEECGPLVARERCEGRDRRTRDPYLEGGSDQRNRRPRSSGFGSGLRRCAHIIAVSVSREGAVGDHDGRGERDGELAEEGPDRCRVMKRSGMRTARRAIRSATRSCKPILLRTLQRGFHRGFALFDASGAMSRSSTMASSTTKPVEIVSAISVRLFRL